MRAVMPGVSAARPKYVFDVGSVSICSRDRFCWLTTFCTSITGLAPETVTVSSMEPTVIWPSTLAVKSDTSSIPSRTNVLNPGNVNVNVTVYVPGRSASIVYRPAPSVTVARTPSINAGLAASTVTPGSTPPVSSDTLPAMAPVWASAATGSNSMQAATAALACFIRIQFIDSSSISPQVHYAPSSACHAQKRPQAACTTGEFYPVTTRSQGAPRPGSPRNPAAPRSRPPPVPTGRT